VERSLYVVVETKKLTLKQVLSVPCPTCGAATEEACELHTGALRTEPHILFGVVAFWVECWIS
jgi:hypothetical protein